MKLSSNPKKASLHSKLFIGAFAYGLALVTDLPGSAFHLKIVIDRVDKSILNSFDKEIKRLLSAEQPYNKKVTGYDTEKKKVMPPVNVEISVVSDPSMLGNFADITYEIECADSFLTQAADVLVYSVYHHLKRIQDATPGAALNSPAAIKGHPLEHLVYGMPSYGASVNLADTVFRHPNMRLDTGSNDS